MRPIDADEITATLEIAISMMENTKSIISVENLPVIDVEIKAYTDILKGIKEQPTVQPEPQWIPCEERMPEKTPLWKTVGYLATVTCDSWEEPRTMYVKWETTTVRGKEVSRWTFDNRLFPPEWRVVAWMPMPEAYKEGGERI